MSEKLRIPLPFGETISAVLKAKPPEAPERKPKTDAKRPGRKLRNSGKCALAMIVYCT